ncbi:MAG TPA: ABC transporter permease [Pirellulales bacterium]|jgi:lipoprotein-releasing system permease protein|nr:ABC transporter permease [Pirellulales bacterium]
MYKQLLCWRYLRTRWIAIASIISVTLGVATMIVVNSVMSGFSHEMQKRMRGIYADLLVEAQSMDGMHDARWHKEQIRQIAGDQIEAMSATVVVPAMLSYRAGASGQWINRQINFIGVEEDSVGAVSDFGKYLQHPANREQLRFALRDGGYDLRDHNAGPDSPERPGMDKAGWGWRRFWAQRQKEVEELRAKTNPPIATADAAPTAAPNAANPNAAEPAANQPPPAEAALPVDPFQAHLPLPEQVFDPAKEQYAGVVLGMSLVSFRGHDGADHLAALPGDDVKITFPTAGSPPKGVSDTFTIVDYYESKMSEYDSSVVFVPIQKLQEMRGMIDPSTHVANVNAIQIKLKDASQSIAVRDKLRKAFPPELYGVYTWRDKQSTLLDAVEMETAVLNILLFMIIAVAGFGILAIFFMIVVEKTKDIGILKSLGASARGIMAIFLGYGLSLGLVGCGAGLIIGLLFVHYINSIKTVLEWVTGRRVFDPAVYYFQQIPTIIQPWTVAWIVVGALVIAVLASVLPARRAARLHPVKALRYE